MIEDFLIINEQYSALRENNELRKQKFLVDGFLECSKSNSELTKEIALILKEKDSNLKNLYAIEIKSSGGSRALRIPFVRISNKTKSIWKIARVFKDIEKTAMTLNELEESIKQKTPQDSLIKILVLLEKEDNYLQNKKYLDFLNERILKEGIKIISLEFLIEFFKEKTINFDELLKDSEKLFTINKK